MTRTISIFGEGMCRKSVLLSKWMAFGSCSTFKTALVFSTPPVVTGGFRGLSPREEPVYWELTNRSCSLTTRNRIERDWRKRNYAIYAMRQPLSDGGFDAAVNVFSSLGYGTEEDDLAILKTLARAVRRGGLVLVETNHRDFIVAHLPPGTKPAQRLPDGTLLVEEPKFDPIRGRVETSWFWSGPKGSGKKTASIRIYAATEWVSLLKRAGLQLRSAHKGCSTEPFEANGRLALLAERS